MKVRYGSVALLLVLIMLLAAGITAITGVKMPQKTREDFSVVVSFYPLYTATLNVVGECEGVTVTCLTQPTTGCLHDYQLSPAERVALNRADVLVLNGAGMESFLEPVLQSLPQLTCIDTSASVSLLSCEKHEEHRRGAHDDLRPEGDAQQGEHVAHGRESAAPVQLPAAPGFRTSFRGRFAPGRRKRRLFFFHNIV